MSPPHPSLARLLAARLCHDLGGAVATLAGTLELVEPGDPAMLELARETAQALRLRLYAAAWGGAPGGDLDAAGLGALLGGAPAVPRVRFALERLAPEGVLPAGIVPLALNAALLAAEALPQGGTVHLGGDAVQGLAAWPEGRTAAWPPGLLASLAGTASPDLEEGGPRRVLIPLTLALAAEAGWRAELGLGAAGSGRAAPLMLTPG